MLDPVVVSAVQHERLGGEEPPEDVPAPEPPCPVGLPPLSLPGQAETTEHHQRDQEGSRQPGQLLGEEARHEEAAEQAGYVCVVENPESFLLALAEEVLQLLVIHRAIPSL